MAVPYKTKGIYGLLVRDDIAFSSAWHANMSGSPAPEERLGAAEELRAEFPGRLEFVLDGNAKPMSCLKHRWRPWNATWIPSDHSPAEAEFSNNASQGWDRLGWDGLG